MKRIPITEYHNISDKDIHDFSEKIQKQYPDCIVTTSCHGYYDTVWDVWVEKRVRR